jgi:hypothetical protein
MTINCAVYYQNIVAAMQPIQSEENLTPFRLSQNHVPDRQQLYPIRKAQDHGPG